MLPARRGAAALRGPARDDRIRPRVSAVSDSSLFTRAGRQDQSKSRCGIGQQFTEDAMGGPRRRLFILIVLAGWPVERRSCRYLARIPAL